MAINYINNQPVFFGTEQELCDCPIVNFPQLINPGDISQVQFRIDDCGESSTEIDIEESEGAFSITTSDIIYTNGLYKLTFTITDLVGTLNIQFGDTGDSFDFTSDGTYTIFGKTETTDDTEATNITFTAGGGTLTNVSFIELKKDLIISFWNDGYINQINTTDNPELFVFDKDTITVSINWSDYIEEDGCYHLCLHDSCLNTNAQNGLYNGDFKRPDGWVNNGEGWVIAAGKAAYLGSGGDEFVSEIDLTPGISYVVTYTIDFIEDITFRIQLGGTNGIERTNSGTYTETIICGPSQYFRLVALPGDPEQAIVIDDVRLQVSGEDLVCDLTSNTFKYGDHQCALRINACNDEDGLGFNFESSGFSPMARIDAALINAGYTGKRITDPDSLGKANVIYSNRRKTKKLRISDQPEYMHDFLSLLKDFDRFYIDDIEYFSEDDEYEPIYNQEEPLMGSSIITVSVKTQDVKNQNIGNAENSCVIGESLWVDENGGFVIDNDQTKIII